MFSTQTLSRTARSVRRWAPGPDIFQSSCEERTQVHHRFEVDKPPPPENGEQHRLPMVDAQQNIQTEDNVWIFVVF